ncbi:MAG TPA: Imm52 family immunity protein [Pseudonocardiaceae bacterium]
MAEETFYVGAYWGPRDERVEDCARRLAQFLAVLGEIDPLLGSWFQTAGSRSAALKMPVDPSADALRELLLAGQNRRDFDDRSVITELGYSVGIWNGQVGEVGLNVTCGASISTPHMSSNLVLIDLPDTEGEALRLYRRDTALAVVRATVTAWQPSWCTWAGRLLRKAQGRQPDEIVVGWATYVADGSRVEVDRLPAGAMTEPLNGGLLITANGDADSASEATVLAIRDALGPALHQ